MKKIITAVNYPVINQYLKEKCIDFEVLEEDIQYQEALLEILKKGIPDVLVLNEELPGPFDKKTLIEKIRQINKYFRIILIVSIEDKMFNNFLYAKGVFDVLVNDQAEIIDLISAINKENKVMVKVKKEIPPELHEKLKKLEQEVKEKPVMIEKKVVVKAPPEIQRQEIITVTGAGSVGKSNLVTQLAIVLAIKSKAKILVIDLNTEFPSLDQFFGVPKEPQTVDYFIGEGKNSCLNYMIDSIDKEKFDTNVFKELVIKHKKLDNVHVLTGNHSLYACQNTLNTEYYKTILDKAKTLYDFIFIDTSSNIFLDSTQFAVTNATSVLFMVEGTYASLRKAVTMLDLYTTTWDIPKQKIQIIVNKYNLHSLEKEIVEEILKEFSIYGYIKYNSKHDFYLNRSTPMILKANKKDLTQYLKILEEFNFVEKTSLFQKLFKNKEQKIDEQEIKYFKNEIESEDIQC